MTVIDRSSVRRGSAGPLWFQQGVRWAARVATRVVVGSRALLAVLLAVLLPVLLLVALLLSAPAARGPAWAAEPRLSPRAAQAAFTERLEQLLIQSGFGPEQASLLVFSTREGRYLHRQAIERPMIAASNAKLATTYAALRVLSPDYRWRTRFYAVLAHDDAGGPPRQGLLVLGTGDPTLTRAELERMALELRARGIARLDGGIWLDGSRFDDVEFPATWGDVSRGEAWFAPVSPFIVEKNVVEFLIASRHGAPGFDVRTAAPGFTLVSALEQTGSEPPSVRMNQHWQGDTATFTFLGALAPAETPYTFAAAVERPRVYFYRHLRAAFKRVGMGGAMPLREGPAPTRGALLHSILSPPLREVIVDVNKNSSNLGAEVLLRTMGLLEHTESVSAKDGLAVLRRTLVKEFPDAPRTLHLVDGSGLSRENRVTAEFLVRLLNRVRGDFSLRPEFINSLSVALTDGTLQYRNYPWRMRGKLRAKTGTLAGVSNISGYLQLRADVVIFSLLVHDPSRHFTVLQEAQDRVLTDLYDALLAREAREPALADTPPARRSARR